MREPFLIPYAKCLFRTGSYLRGGNRLRRSWKLFRRLKDDYDGDVVRNLPDETVCDLQVGVGAFHFAVSLIPQSFSWLAELIGTSQHSTVKR